MKKILTLSLVFLMLFSFNMSVFAAPLLGADIISTDFAADEVTINQQERMKNVLTQIKLLIDIPEEYTEFDYNLYTRYDDESWDFTWRNEDYTKFIYINADGNGKIISYEHSQRRASFKAPVIFKADALDKAYDFIEKLYPEIMDEVKLVDSDYVYFASNSYSFNFCRNVNGIDYTGSSISISVSNTDGRIVSFYINWDEDLSFDKPENIISSTDALAKWKVDSAMDLKYRIFTNYENGEYKDTVAKLIYINRENQKNILALTGDYLEENYTWSDDYYDDAEDSTMKDEMNSAMGSESSRVEFTESELKRLEELAGYISVNEADKKLRSYKKLAIDDTFKLASYSTGYNYQPYTNSDDRPIVWNLNYTGIVKEGDFSPLTAAATVDAKTGELISFYSYRYYDYFDENGNFVKPVLVLNEEGAQKLADEFLMEVQPEKHKDLTFASSHTNNTINYISNEYGREDAQNDGFYYTSVATTFNRTHNGIQVMSNGANITVDCVEGKIINYSVNWTDNLAFDSDKALIDEKEALDIYLENSKVDLRYIPYTIYIYDQPADRAYDKEMYLEKYAGDIVRTYTETRLIYGFNAPFYAVSAVSAQPINYDGKVYEQPVIMEFDGFDDISGHWAEEKIKLLSDIGVVLPADSFRPDDAITQKEFIAMLVAVANGSPIVKSYTELDKNMDYLISEMNYRNYYISDKDADIQPDASLMRKDAAKFIMRALGYERIATLGNIFKTDFIDNDKIDTAYIGYAAIAKALGIINGSDGRFNGDENITRAESVILIYNYINADK